MLMGEVPVGTKVRIVDDQVVPPSIFEGEVIFPVVANKYALVEGVFKCDCCRDLPKTAISVHPGSEVTELI